MEKEIIRESPKSISERYPVSQEQIDNILEDELKNFDFPIKPVYNSRIRANGMTKAEFYAWGELKRITAIEIGRQDKTDRKFLIDTLIHEYYEAEIMKRQYTDDFFKKLDKSGDIKRHTWINTQIEKFFKELEGQK